MGIIAIFSFGSVFAQENDSLTGTYISAQEAMEELNLMHDVIIAHHPDPFKYTNAEALALTRNRLLEKIADSISESDMHILVRLYLKEIRCGHTVARPSAQWYADQIKNARFLPFRVLLHDDRIYVDTLVGAAVPVNRGSEITSINGFPSGKILSEMKSIQPQDGEAHAFVTHQIEKIFSTYFLFLHGWENEYHIVFKTDNGPEIVHNLPGLKAGSFKSNPAMRGSSLPEKADTLATMAGAVFSSLTGHSDLFYLDIETFSNSGYKKFYKRIFEMLEDKKEANLIIDIRNNGGGYFPNTNNLLRYISDSTIHFTFQRPRTKPEKNPNIKMGVYSRMTKSVFSLIKDPLKADSLRTYLLVYKPKRKKHFSGPIYLLTNGGSFSMSGDLAAILKYQKRAVLVGDETGGGASGSNGILFNQMILPHSGIRITLTYFHLQHELKETGGVMPDHLISYSLDERLQGPDKEFQKVLDLIAAGKN